ncbi:MAG: 3-hydroxyacyl-CoA dehydrogenase family protein [Burkholderiales bacterium]|jgi:3-hydroxybutyryl-CoA dehydrogenase
MKYSIVKCGNSRSFPEADQAFVANASQHADVVVYLGAFGSPGSHALDEAKRAILLELDTECLGVHTGEHAGEEGSNVVGFARYRNGDDAPSSLIELVRQPRTSEPAIDTARELFEAAGFTVVVSSDQAGRIIDRLVRPKYNAALRFLDEGLASAKDMDLTCRLGLGYPAGPIERVERGGLARHYEITQALFETWGTPGFAPARRSVVAHVREQQHDRQDQHQQEEN